MHDPRPLTFKALRLCCVALLAIFASSIEAAEGKPLFSAERPAAAAPQRPPSARASRATGADPARDEPRLPVTERERPATMDAERLAALRLDVQEGSNSPILLNLFADTELKTVFERTEPTPAGYTLTGRIEGQPHSTVVLAVNGDMVAGTVWTHDAIHTIEGIGSAAVIRQAGPGAFGQCPTPPHPERGSSQALPPSGATATHRSAPHDDDGSVIDLLVVYPSLVRRSQGGHRFMRALIDRDVALANEAYRASSAAQRLNLVAAVEVEHAAAEKDANMFRIIRHLESPASGYMDEVHALRDSYAADLVLQHRGDFTGTGVAIGRVSGIANQMRELSAEAEAPHGFSVSNSFAFSHELGHNMGLRHDRSLDVRNTPFPYSHGYVVTDPPEQLEGAYTIMAYGATEKKLPRFSNPNLRYPDADGVALGVPGDQPSDSADGPADAVRSLNGTRRVVANFRRSANRCAYSLSSPSTVPAAGGAHRVQIDTTPNCAWAVHSNDPFVSITSSAGGTGAGSVSYAVSANPGWEREVALMIAGEVHLTKQAGARALPPPAVCERSRSVRDALVEALGKPCANITAQDLASLRQLWVSFLYPGPWFGDFLGLVNLLDLEVLNTDLNTLPANVFDGLPNLSKLTLKFNNSLQTIQSGAFNGLVNLHALEIEESGLTSLQPGAFHGLYNLHRLEIDTTPVPLHYVGWNNPTGSILMSLQPGAFHGLHNLHALRLHRVRLAELRKGAFDGLSELDELNISSQPLSDVAPGAFRGLPKLTYLVFNATSITTLPPDVFVGLESLEDLVLRYHENLRTLPPGVFNHLPKLTSLDIHETALTTLPNGLFDGLSNLETLWIYDNPGLATAEPGAFTGLDKLRILLFSDNLLTELIALRGLSNLEVLSLNNNAITDISALSSLTRLRNLYLANNLISNVAPLVANPGLSPGDYIRLDGNPWSAGAVAVDIPALRRRGVEVNANAVVRIAGDAQAEEGEPLVFPVALQPPQTRDVAVDWEAPNRGAGVGWAEEGMDYLAQRGTLILPAGAISGSFSVETLEDDRHERDEWFWVDLVARGRLVDGLYFEWDHGDAIILDDDAPPDANRPPKAISGLADVYAVAGTQTTLSIAGLFADPDGDALTVAAASTSPAVATADAVQAGMLAIEAVAPGLAGVAVTATDPHGESAALAFAVRVSASPESVADPEDDLAVAMGDAARVDLLASFRELDAHALAFTAQSSNPAVATVRIQGNSATVEPASEGSTQIVVTARDPIGGIRTVQFTVTVGGALSHSHLPAWLLPALAGEEANEESQRE